MITHDYSKIAQMVNGSQPGVKLQSMLEKEEPMVGEQWACLVEHGEPTTMVNQPWWITLLLVGCRLLVGWLEDMKIQPTTNNNDKYFWRWSKTVILAIQITTIYVDYWSSWSLYCNDGLTINDDDLWKPSMLIDC